MDHYWLITWTCYGHWLPGDARGFVGNVRDDEGRQVVHNIPGTPYDADMPRLENWVRKQMSGPTVSLSQREADAMVVPVPGDGTDQTMGLASRQRDG